ncbi:MAG: hypothetical protein ACRCXX_13660 [Cetobacterium sp.]|uniref:hypothetical protein n=1 Tax=Cetobacterium sp. TaxID=2071632 RepID=UPI003F36E36A
MKKIILITILVFTTALSNSTIDKYVQYEELVNNLDIKMKMLELKKLESQFKVNEAVRKEMYKNAEFRISTEREELKNEAIRAKIYWYKHNGYKRYYYYDFSWNIIYLN